MEGPKNGHTEFKPQTFVIIIEKDGKQSKHGVAALNLESIRQLMTIFVATRWPRVSGYVILSEDEKTILDSVPAAPFVAQVDATVLQAGIPVVSPRSEDFNKLFQEQKRLRDEERRRGPL